MPFAKELHYFFLYLQKHIEEKHAVECKRGDADVLTVPVLDKIRSYVEQADVLIADCSGRNANVFYELGMAHALGKRVILMTKDPIEEAPADIRHFEFIRYDLSKDKEFLDSIDRALRAVFVERYDRLYEIACGVFEEFKSKTSAKPLMEKKDVFIERVVAGEQLEELPSLTDEAAVREFVLPRIIANKDQKEVIEALAKWYAKELAQTGH
jgi:hypothetical protein